MEEAFEQRGVGDEVGQVPSSTVDVRVGQRPGQRPGGGAGGPGGRHRRAPQRRRVEPGQLEQVVDEQAHAVEAALEPVERGVAVGPSGSAKRSRRSVA